MEQITKAEKMRCQALQAAALVVSGTPRTGSLKWSSRGGSVIQIARQFEEYLMELDPMAKKDPPF